MGSTMHNDAPLQELLCQTLETELGGVKVYETALTCVRNEDLRKEWREYLEHTRHHVQVIQGVFDALGLDLSTSTPGRKAVAHIGKALVQAMELALAEGDAAVAELVATECVYLAETKDHANWELIGHVAKQRKGPEAKAMRAAFAEVEKDEDEHLYHTKGWSRELWIDALGLPAVLPPPEEVRHVATAIGAARAEQSRGRML